MDDLLDELYPEITLETDDLAMVISVKKDYSKFTNSDERKKEFIKDLHSFIEEFSQTQESNDFVGFLSD